MSLAFTAVLFVLGAVGAFVSGLVGVGGAIVMIPLLLYVPPLLGVGALDIKAVAAITMVQSGDYLTPRWPDGRSNLHKPIVAYWVVAASYTIFGITLPASRLPFMVAGALVIAATYVTGLALTGRRDTALLAAMITASEPQLILSSMRAIPDVLLCLFTLLSAYGFLGLVVLGRRTAATYWSAYLGAALAIETKGLLALVFVAFAWVFALLDRGAEPISSRLRALLHLPSMLVALAVAVSWYVAMYGLHRDRLVKIFFGDQITYNVQFLDGTPLIRIPIYLGFLLINLLPWSVLLVPLAIWDRQSFRPVDASLRRAQRFIVLWAVLTAIVFGLGNKIEPRYLLPAGPLLAILLAATLVNWWISASRFGYGLIAIRENEEAAAVLGVNTNTVLRALHLLRDEGLLDFRRGRGITVASTSERGAVVVRAKELVEFARSQGYRRDDGVVGLPSSAMSATCPASADREKSGVAGVVAAMLGGPCCACGTDDGLPRGGGAPSRRG